MRRVLFAMAVIAGACALAAPARAGHVPPGVEWYETYFPSEDGTPLHAHVYRPRGVEGAPVILGVSPYYNERAGEPMPLPYTDLVDEGRIFERGYALVLVSLRGFAGSGGCGDLGGPGEQADAKAAVEWAASQSWSSRKVGMWGLSYEGWTQVMALATRPRGLAAAVVQSPVLSLYRALYMNGNHYSGTWHAAPAAYAQYDLTPNNALGPLDRHTNSTLGTLSGPRCYADNEVETLNPHSSTAYWRNRDLVSRAAHSEVPVLWSHGFQDANTKPDNFLDVWTTLRGPRRAWFGQYHHMWAQDLDPVGGSGFMDEAMRWFDRYLKEEIVADDPPVKVQTGRGRWRAEAQWPPADAGPFTLPLLPGEYQDAPGNRADGRVDRQPSNGSWTFTRPLPYDLHLTGAPIIDADLRTVAPEVSLVGFVYAVDPDGRGTLVTRGAAVAPSSGRVRIPLYPQDYLLPAGYRMAVLLTGSDDGWFTPGLTHTTVRVADSTLTAHFLRFRRTSFLSGNEGRNAPFYHASFLIPAATVEERTLDGPLPPPMEEGP